MSRWDRRRLPRAILLGACALAYGTFRLSRPHLPPGVFRDSFPSFLLPVVMFTIVDLRRGIGFRTAKVKALVLSATLAVAILWFEWLVPRIAARSVGDVGDACAMLAGFLVYLGIDQMLTRTGGPVAAAAEAAGEAAAHPAGERAA